MYKVLLTDSIVEDVQDVFEKYPDIEAVITGTLSDEDLTDILPDYDAIIVRSPTRLSKEILAHGKKLKFIGRAGAGCDNIDLSEATKRGITVMNVRSGNIISTAEHTMALILALARRIPQAHFSVTSGAWDRNSFKGIELYGKTLGIIGFGRVGREVAKRALAFSMQVVATDPNFDEKAAHSIGVRGVDLETLLKLSHFVTIHVPLNDSTRLLISMREIEIMKDGAYLVNCARGGVIDEKAVESACRSGKLAGVALDVFSREPPVSKSLCSTPSTVFTPHIGGATQEAHVRVAVEISIRVAEALVNGVVRSAVNRPEPDEI